jgi:hypothetical protein
MRASLRVTKSARNDTSTPIPEICDPRLHDLEIRSWTGVKIDNATAARCISLYLETDHPLLGNFDPELFVPHLISGDTEYCSSLLVNALLYWASVWNGILVRILSGPIYLTRFTANVWLYQT